MEKKFVRVSKDNGELIHIFEIDETNVSDFSTILFTSGYSCKVFEKKERTIFLTEGQNLKEYNTEKEKKMLKQQKEKLKKDFEDFLENLEF